MIDHTKNNELIVFLHNDLDAAGCILNIEFKFPFTKKKYFFTNYGNLDKIVSDIEEYVKDNGYIHKNILIADVSFATNRDALIKLNNLFKGSKIIIDHHMYPDNFWNEFQEFKIIWDTEKSATLLCNEHFKNKGKNKNLDILSNIIDVYDLWQVNHKYFDFSQNLNEYFWTYDISEFCSVVKLNNYNLPDDFSEKVKSINDKIKSDIEDYKNRKLIYRVDKLSILFVQNWFNQINIQEMKEGQNIVLGITPFGIIRFRINENAPYSNKQKIKFRELLSGESNTGHLNAFTFKIKGSNSKQSTFDELMNEVKRIIKIVSEIINEE